MSKKRKAGIDDSDQKQKASKLFSGLVFYLYQPTKRRYEKRAKCMLQNGAKLCHSFDASISHVIIDSATSEERTLQSLKWKQWPPNAKVVNGAWFQNCLNQNQLLDPDDKDFKPPPSPKRIRIMDDAESIAESTDQPKLKPSGPTEATDEDVRYCYELRQETQNILPEKSAVFDDMDRNMMHPNIWAITVFSVLAEYWSHSIDNNGQFRVRNYRYACSKLRNQENKVMNFQEARDLGLGERISEKLELLVRDGRHDDLEEILKDGSLKVMSLFTKIHGVGLATAKRLYDNNCRTLEDVAKQSLSESQRIGVEHYEDFNTKIPRHVVEMHFAAIEKELMCIDLDMQAECMGSYRRGKAMCGDIDIMLTKRDVDDLNQLIPVKNRLVDRLKKLRIIKCTLIGLDGEDSTSTRWLGATVVNGDNGTWRRMDFFVAKYSERGAAALHCTGSFKLNIDLAMKAIRKGWKLTEYGLFVDPRSDSERRYQRIQKHQHRPCDPRHLIEAADEREIFRHLEVEYLEPQERNI